MAPDEPRSRSSLRSWGGLVVGVSGWAWKGIWREILVCFMIFGVVQCLDEPTDQYSLGLDARTSSHGSGSSSIEDSWRPPDDSRAASPASPSTPELSSLSSSSNEERFPVPSPIEASFRPPLDHSSPVSSEQQLHDSQTTSVASSSIEDSFGFGVQELSNTSSTEPFPVPVQSGVSDPRPSGREHATNINHTIQPSINKRKKKNGWFFGCGLQQVVTSKERRSRDS